MADITRLSRRLSGNFVNLSDTARRVGEAYTSSALRAAAGARAMIRLFKHYVPYAVLLLGAIDFALLMLAAEAGWSLRLWQLAGEFDPDAARLPNMLAFAATLQAAMVAVGVYGVEALQSVRFAVARLLVAVALGIIAALASSSSSSRRSASGARACSTRSGSRSSA